MDELSTIQPVTLRQQIVEQVRVAIIEGILKPGDHVTEAELTKRLGVSRTPVREALILLESEGLITFFPNRGAFVRAFEKHDVDEIFSMRISQENFAAELLIGKLRQDDFDFLEAVTEKTMVAIQRDDLRAARRSDMAFHQHLIEQTKHSILIKSWQQLVAQIAALLYVRAEAFPQYAEWKAMREDHTEIIAAYREKNLGAVQEANRRINLRVADDVKKALEIVQPY